MRDLASLHGYIPAMPSFRRSPRVEDPEAQMSPDATPASQSVSRFAALHNNVRSMVNGSSIYSASPAPSNNNTPKPPFLGFLNRRPQSPPDIVVPNNDVPRDSSDSRSPLRPQHTAGSYMRAIAPQQDPSEPHPVYNHHAERHPADVPLGHPNSVDPETEQLQDEVHGRRRRHRHHHHRRRKHQQRPTHWIRRKNDRGFCFGYIQSQAGRGKALACMLSGLFLVTVLAIYLALALTNGDLGQEVHVLFIMVVLATTIFFCHSLIRLCMLMLHPPQETPRIPSMTGPDGFQPVRPIRVHLARDAEYGARRDSDDVSDSNDTDGDRERDIEAMVEKEKPVQLPPPAYGLWRSSVRVDPNLIHWQRVEARNAAAPPPSHPGSRNGSVSGAPSTVVANEEPQGPRPPSYASEDGVSYIMEAAPRSTAPGHSGVSDIHPAWRPGYAMSEVHLAEWPAPQRV